MFVLFGIGYTARAYQLQVSQGAAYLAKSENNRLRKTTVFAERGAITDRDGVALAWNASNPSNTDFALRQYIDSPAFSHVLGYVKYPSKDASGYYYSKRYDAKDGVEAHYDDLLSGENGVKLSETDALGKVQSENTIQLPRAGLPLALSIDGRYSATYVRSGKVCGGNCRLQGRLRSARREDRRDCCDDELSFLW